MHGNAIYLVESLKSKRFNSAIPNSNGNIKVHREEQTTTKKKEERIEKKICVH